LARSGSSVVLPALLIGLLVILALGGLVVLVNPGHVPPLSQVDTRDYWYTGLTKSDKGWIALLGRLFARVHRSVRSAWTRATAATVWLLGR